MKDPDVRWQQRLQNFTKAYGLLHEILNQHCDITTLEPIVKEGIVQRFESTFELAWKTLKDKMQADGVELQMLSPRAILKLAFQSGYIDHIETWLNMVSDRNLVAHAYDLATSDKVLSSLQNQYAPLIDKLHNDLTIAAENL